VDILNVLLKSVAAPSLADADSLDDLLGPDVATTATASASSASTVVEESRWSGHFDTDALRPSYSIMVCFAALLLVSMWLNLCSKQNYLFIIC
jgi:hypothetical protein